MSWHPRLTAAENALFDDEDDIGHRGYSPEGDDDVEPDVPPPGPGPVSTPTSVSSSTSTSAEQPEA